MSASGVFVTLDPPGSVRSQGGFINTLGQVVGTYRSIDEKRHGFIWSSGPDGKTGAFTSVNFNVPADDPVGGTVAFGINNPGQVVGAYVAAADGVCRGFLLSNGVYTPIVPPDAGFTVAEGINNAGQIVGVYFTAADVNLETPHRFILSGGVYTTVDVSGATGTEVNSIDATGEIAGTYFDAYGVGHGFIGTPTP
jgi:uncharacterized membrane protein